MPSIESKKSIIFLSLIAAFAVYGISLFFPKFIFDDDLNVYQNWQVQHLSLKNTLHFLETSLTPIPYITWQFISNLSGHFSTWNYRLVNIIFHALNASLVYLLTLKVLEYLQMKSENSRFAMVATFIFLFHPVQVESVVWISSLRILMATFFSLLSCSLLFSLLFLKKDKGDESKYNAQFIYPASILLFALALLCKPTILPLITILFYIPLIKVTLSKNHEEKSVAIAQFKKITFPVILIIIVGLLSVILHKSEVLSEVVGQNSLLDKVNIALLSISTFFINLFIPFRLGFDYQVNNFVINYLIDSNNFFQLSLLAVSILLIILSLCALKKYQPLGLLALMTLTLVSPHLGLIFQDFQNISTVADRYLYIALIPFSWLITSILYFAIPKRHLFKVLACLGILILTLCFKQISLWHKPKDLLLRSNTYDEIQPPLLIAIGQNYESRGFPIIARDYYKSALAKDLRSREALSSLIYLTQENPSPKEDAYVVDYVIRNNSQVSPEDSIPFVKILLRIKRHKMAKEILRHNISHAIMPTQTQSLLFELENTSDKLLIQSYEILYQYHLGINQPKKAYEYLKKLIALPNAPNHLIQAYEEHLSAKSGKN